MEPTHDRTDIRETLGNFEPSETILLVDDTEILREWIAESLDDLGYNVLVACSGDEAVNMATKHEGPISILLTDIIMPGMTGPELAARIAVTRPETRVLFMSGSGPEAVSDPAVLKAGGEVLEKPFTQVELGKALRDRLDRVVRP